MLLLCDVDRASLQDLLQRHALDLQLVPAAHAIPGSYWGECEAGLVGSELFARADTPLHSVLHEAAHFVCMSGVRRAALSTDAGGDDAEENAVCYLQVIWADLLPAVGRERLFEDMNAWGYSFRLGCARRWFREDASDARQWLQDAAILAADDQPTFRVRT